MARSSMCGWAISHTNLKGIYIYDIVWIRHVYFNFLATHFSAMEKNTWNKHTTDSSTTHGILLCSHRQSKFEVGLVFDKFILFFLCFSSFACWQNGLKAETSRVWSFWGEPDSVNHEIDVPLPPLHQSPCPVLQRRPLVGPGSTTATISKEHGPYNGLKRRGASTQHFKSTWDPKKVRLFSNKWDVLLLNPIYLFFS